MMHKGMCGRNENNGPASVAKVEPPQGEIVVTWSDDHSRILAVTRQDEDHRILSVIAEAPAAKVEPRNPDWCSGCTPDNCPGCSIPAAPAGPSRKPLTDERIDELDCVYMDRLDYEVFKINRDSVREFARAIESAISHTAPAAKVEPSREPVAWMDEEGRFYRHNPNPAEKEHGLPLSRPVYFAAPTAPAERKPLTDEQIDAGIQAAIELATAYERAAFRKGVKFAQRAHGITTEGA